jgi:hypothetical protein
MFILFILYFYISPVYVVAQQESPILPQDSHGVYFIDSENLTRESASNITHRIFNDIQLHPEFIGHLKIQNGLFQFSSKLKDEFNRSVFVIHYTLRYTDGNTFGYYTLLLLLAVSSEIMADNRYQYGRYYKFTGLYERTIPIEDSSSIDINPEAIDVPLFIAESISQI